MTPEEYLEKMCEDKDMSALSQFVMLAQAKYQQMQANHQLEQIKNG